MKTLNAFLLLVFVGLVGCAGSSQLYTDPTGFNWDFELADELNRPVDWYLGGIGPYNCYLDSEIVYSGNKSLKIAYIRQRSNAFGVATSGVPVEEVRGKKVKLSGYIRTKDIEEGYAGLWFRIDGPSHMTRSLALENMSDRGVIGTTDWKQYSIEMQVDPTATNVVFGAIQTGKGTAWFDNFSIEIDGKPYSKERFVMSNDQLAWLKSHATPFETTQPGAALTDLNPIMQIISDAQVIGLGEATYGTKEFYQMKHRLLEAIASTSPNLVLTIPANMTESHTLNNYVVNGVGIPFDYLQKKYSWRWDTKEFVDMINWIKAYNSSGKGRIEVLGYNMEYMAIAADSVVAFLRKNDPVYADSAEAKYEEIKAKILSRKTSESKYRYTNAEMVTEAQKILLHLQSSAPRYQAANTSAYLAQVIQHANCIVQTTTYQLDRTEPSYEDSCKSANIKWIKEHAPANAKVIVWGHNFGVSKADEHTGDYLEKFYGNSYRAIGFKFHEGTFRARNRYGGLGNANTVRLSPNGSLDWALHSVGFPLYVVDLRKASPHDPRSSWLFNKLETKEIWNTVTDGYRNRAATDEFDAIIFFAKTTASNPYDPSE